MSREVYLLGPLTHSAMCDVLALKGEQHEISGRLVGGRFAGIKAGEWPHFVSSSDRLEALRATTTPELCRYAEMMGLSAIEEGDRLLLGVQRSGCQDQQEWSVARWQPELAAAIAQLILDEPDNLPPEGIMQRLPMLGVWAESQLRAQAAPVAGGDVTAIHDLASDLRVHRRHQPFAGFFAIEEWQLSHRKFDGSFSPEIKREGFVMGDAVVVLPWDPVRDRVMLVEQFRLGPAMRRDRQPWMLEAIAGRIDVGETAEQAALREAKEEANLDIQRLLPTIHHYPSPGAVTEFLYQFIGIADLPDGIAGVHGLASEAEDIRSHVLPREKLSQMLADGDITNGPLAMQILWLEGQSARIRAELCLNSVGAVDE